MNMESIGLSIKTKSDGIHHKWPNAMAAKKQTAHLRKRFGGVTSGEKALARRNSR